MKKEHLHNINDSGFRTPSNYFETLDDVILNEAKLKNSINKTAFKTPELYFKNVEEDILNLTVKRKETKVIPLTTKRIMIYASAIAAAVILIFNLNLFNDSITFDNLETETVDNYIIDETELSELAMLINETELTESSFIDIQINDETFNNYINSLDETELILE